MNEQVHNFRVGDNVIHDTYGPGIIVDLDEKELSGRTRQYYVVNTPDLTLWVPSDPSGKSCLRLPTPAQEFEELFRVLAGSGEPLSTNRMERKTELMERFKEGDLAAICRVVRDLISFKRDNRVNDQDNAILERARNFLLSEWSIALAIPRQQAEQELNKLLRNLT